MKPSTLLTPLLAAVGAMSTSTTTTPKHYAMAVFPAFQALDVFGPLDVLNMLSLQQNITLSILASTLDPVSTRPTSMNPAGSSFGESIVPTHTFANAPADIDVLIVPGGLGTRGPHLVADTVQFVRERYPDLQYLLSVCTGGALLAQSGVLDGRRATTNKRAWAWATAQGPKVNWVAKARWVTDGNIWSSSGVAAGIDLMYAFVGHLYGEQVAKDIADGSEYVRNTDEHNDPFAERWNVTQKAFPGGQ